MNTLAKISCGISDNLITRSATVMIKEQRKLIIAPREMPFSAIALENMLKLSRLGVIIAPPTFAYYANINVQHWQLIEKILQTINAKIIVPDYPLAPEANCIDVYSFMTTLYTRIITENPNKRIILMGDSAGGGIALGFAQKSKNDNVKQPDEIILFSPWLDVSMSNPDIINFEKNDNILSKNGLKHAGIKYAGNLNQTDYRVSPIYGDFKGLGKISIFTGTNDMLIADARKCKLLLEKQNIPFNYFEYQDMFHDWVIITSLIESQDVINKIGEIIN